MSKHMKEAERLVSGLISAVDFEDQSAETKARAALLAHIQRGAVPEGWQLVPKEPTPEMLDAAEAVDWGGGDEDTRGSCCNQWHAMLAAAPAPDQFRDAAKMVPVHCTPTEHEGRIVYEHTSEPIPNADGFVLYAASADQFRTAAKMMAVQPACMTCSGHGMVGGLLPNGGGYQADPCPDCAAPAPAEVPMPEPAHKFFHEACSVFLAYTANQMQQFGEQCRAAGEAAGYARGRADARERICAAIKAEDDYCVTEGDYMLDSDDCIRVASGTWERPDYAALRGEVKP